MKLKSVVAFVLFVTLAVAAFAAPQEASQSLTIGTYPQEVREAYTTANREPLLDVRAVALTAEGFVMVGGGSGLYVNGGKPGTAFDVLHVGNVSAITNAGDVMYLVMDAALWRYSGAVAAGTEIEPVSRDLPGTVNGLEAKSDGAWLATSAGLYWHDEGGMHAETTLNAGLVSLNVIAVASDGKDGVAVAAADGIFEQRGRTGWQRIFPAVADRSWAPVDVRAVEYDATGQLWFASPQGVGVRSAEGAWTLYTGKDGLPYNYFTCMAVAADGAPWFGTHIGLAHLRDGHWGYREGQRWLPGNEVRAIASDGDGAWVATDKGVSHIYFAPMTFARKAIKFEDAIDTYHRRTPYGYVAGVALKNFNDLSEWTQHDTDNDGQYTGMYTAGECLAYGATGDPKAKERATKGFEALAFLSEVTQGGEHPAPPGFPARTILPADGPDPNLHNSVESDIRKKKGDARWKIMDPRWPMSKDGQWYWKSDTSSDELDGHFFAYALYYDLVAETDAEKARCREVVRRVIEHLIVHDYRLVDHDGQPTRWANFSPKDLNKDQDWWTERGLNSFSMLTYLSIAHHVTGDQRYREFYETLAWEHGYALNAKTMPKLQFGPGSHVQFDDKMAFMNYYHLIRYEKDPELLEMYLTSIYYYWQIVRQEKNPFFNFVYAACCLGNALTNQWGTLDVSPTGDWLEESVDTLKRFPYELVNWKFTNSHRIDLVPLGAHTREPGEAEGHGYRVDGHPIPIDERQHTSWSEDVWAYNSGSDGMWLDEGSPFLLAYYMGLYHGFIVEE